MHRRSKFLLFRVYKFRDTGAYGELYDFYIGRIRRFITFRVPFREDAEEIAAEVFLRGWEYATSSMVKNPSALFYRIARNLIADYYRSRKQEDGEEHMDRIADQAQGPDEQLDGKEDHAQLIKHLKSLKNGYKDVLVMRYLDEMSISEIAQALEKSAGSIRVTLYRAKKALQEKMSKKI